MSAAIEDMDRLAAPIVERLEEICGWHRRAKYRLARRIYCMRTEKPAASTEGVPYGDVVDWENSFQELYGEKFEDYLKRAKDENIREQVRKFEQEKLGESDL